MHIPTWLPHLIDTWGYLAVALAIGIESMGIPFPGETTLVLAAVYTGSSHNGHLNVVGVIAAAATGAILGDNLGFLIGLKGGYPLLRWLSNRWNIHPRHLEQGQAFYRSHGSKTVFFGRFVAVLRAWAAFLAGLNRMPWHTFLLWNAAGGILWAIIYGTLGHVLGHNLTLLWNVLHAMGIAGVVGCALVIVAALIWWQMRGSQRAYSWLRTGVAREAADEEREHMTAPAEEPPTSTDATEAEHPAGRGS
ncbi:MAG TPA: DedA family protein [Ktedonobacterales bacterium]